MTEPPIVPYLDGVGFDPGPDPEDDIAWDCDRNLPFEGNEEEDDDQVCQ